MCLTRLERCQPRISPMVAATNRPRVFSCIQVKKKAKMRPTLPAASSFFDAAVQVEGGGQHGFAATDGR